MDPIPTLNPTTRLDPSLLRFQFHLIQPHTQGKEEMAERNAYAELVKDITPRKNTDEPFSSYKDQIGFGLHVVLIMFTGYLVGYAAFRALFGHSSAMSAAGGILGLVLGMLVETLLFIIRTSETSNPDRRPTTSNTSKLNKNQ
ncbi:hypothetical protein OIU76_004302 [Salix suchowensis]|nr:hypothetical protein OIU76_004302 [Salix suchowensis]